MRAGCKQAVVRPACLNLCAETQVEGARRSTSVVRRDLNPVWNTKMKFNITDISADVVIQVCRQRASCGVSNFVATILGVGKGVRADAACAVRGCQVFAVGGSFDNKSKLIGQAVVPLHRLLPELGTKACSIGLVAQWLELFPLPKDKPRFQTIPHKLKRCPSRECLKNQEPIAFRVRRALLTACECNSDVEGMRRPRAALGRVLVEFNLELLMPLSDTYWTALPPLPPSFGGISRAVPRAMSSDDLLPDFKEIKWNVERIEAVLNRAPSWMLLVRAVRSWESPLLSIVFAACAIGIVLTAHVWQLPMLTVSIICALGLLSRKLRPSAREREVVTFYEEDPQAPSVIEKALEAKKQLVDVQIYTGLAAETLERVRNALNWSDDNVSLLLFAALSGIGCLLSVLLLSAQLAVEHLHVNPRYVVVFVLVQALLPPSVRHALHVLFQKGPVGFLLRDVQAALCADLSVHPIVDAATDDELAGYVEVSSAEASEGGSRTHTHKLGLLGSAVVALHRLWKHVPDEMTMTHRVICARQVRSGPLGGLSAELGEAEQPPSPHAGGFGVRGDGSCGSSRVPSQPSSLRHSRAASPSPPAASPSSLGAGTPRCRPSGSGRGMKLGSATSLKATADLLQREVESELEAALTPTDKAFREEAYTTAMEMRVQELIFELRSAGIDTAGLVEKSDLAMALSKVRLEQRKSETLRSKSAQASSPAERVGVVDRGQHSRHAPAASDLFSAETSEAGRAAGLGAEEEAKLGLLVDMGFADAEENRRLLAQFGGDVQKVLDHVLNPKS